MGYRGRILPNVSYFYIHKLGSGKGKNQEDRAAELVRGVVEFKKLVVRSVGVSSPVRRTFMLMLRMQREAIT